MANPQYWVHASVIIGESTVLGTCLSHYWWIHSIGYMLQSLLANPQYWVHASVIIGESTVLGTCFSHYWWIHSIGYMLQSLLVGRLFKWKTLPYDHIMAAMLILRISNLSLILPFFDWSLKLLRQCRIFVFQFYYNPFNDIFVCSHTPCILFLQVSVTQNIQPDFHKLDLPMYMFMLLLESYRPLLLDGVWY